MHATTAGRRVSEIASWRATSFGSDSNGYPA